MRIGIFGGTFDPPHTGHMILAAEADDQLNLNKVLFVLTPDPPHKQGVEISPLLARMDMLQLAISGNPKFELSRVDIDRPEPQYAVDTVRILHRQYTGAELVYLMGGDSLHDLPTWHDPQGFIEACDELGVMHRPDEQINLSMLERELPGIVQKVRFVEAPLLEISSSQIRRRAAEGRPFRYYLPFPVYQYIVDHELYGEEVGMDDQGLVARDQGSSIAD